MNKLTVLSGEVDQREGSFKDDSGNDRAYTTRKQKAKYEDAHGFAYPFDVRLDKDQKPFPPGEYSVDWDAMIGINKGAANLSKFHVLVPFKAAGK